MSALSLKNRIGALRLFRVKRIKTAANIFWVIYFMNSIQIFRFKWEREAFIFNGLVLLFLASFIISRIYPNYLSKEMFLMPLSSTERLMKVKKHYWIKVIVNSSIEIIALGAIWTFGNMRLEGFLVASLFSIMWNLTTQLYYDTSFLEKSYDKKSIFGGCMIWQLMTLVVNAILLMMIFTSVLEESINNFDKWAIGIGMGLQLLLTWKVMKNYYRPILECEVCFEYEGEENLKERKR